MGGALAEEEKKVIKRLNTTDANEEPKSIFNHASRGAEGSRWCVRSAIEVFRGKERERGLHQETETVYVVKSYQMSEKNGQ